MKTLRIITTCLLVIVSAGCASVKPPPPPAPVAPKPVAKPAVKVSRFTLMAQQIAGTTNLPATARTIDPFLRLPKDSTLAGVFLAVGPPDNELGSGSWYYAYRLLDGSTLYVGSNDNATIREMTHVRKDLSLNFIIDNRTKLTKPRVGSDSVNTPPR